MDDVGFAVGALTYESRDDASAVHAFLCGVGFRCLDVCFVDQDQRWHVAMRQAEVARAVEQMRAAREEGATIPFTEDERAWLPE